jgi:hypothetical protein
MSNPTVFTGQPMAMSNARQFNVQQFVNEVVAFRKARLIGMDMCKHFAANVAKGDTFSMPRVNELGTQDRIVGQSVTLQTDDSNRYEIRVDFDRDTAIGLDDLRLATTSYEMRKPYTEALGYALAKDITGHILGLRAALQSFPGQVLHSSSNGGITGNGLPISYEKLLEAKALLMQADVPPNDIRILMGVYQNVGLMALKQFVSKDYIMSKPTLDGFAGMILDMPVQVTSLIGANSAAGWRNGAAAALSPTPGVTGSIYLPKQDAFTSLPLTFTGNGKPVHSMIVCHKDWAATVMSLQPKITESWENLLQMWAIVGRQAGGAKLFRQDHAVMIHTSADIISNI